MQSDAVKVVSRKIPAGTFLATQWYYCETYSLALARDPGSTSKSRSCSLGSPKLRIGDQHDLDDKLAAGEVIVLDGATGTEIARLGGEMDGVAWCALANKTHPDEVRGVHESYLRAGADVIITNTFATCRHVLEGVGLGDETIAINRRAVELAREARENVGPDRPVAVAGSISNMLAWHRGTIGAGPRYRPMPEKETANYREMADLLAESGCDLLVMEMMMDVERATRAIEPAIAHRSTSMDRHQREPGPG